MVECVEEQRNVDVVRAGTLRPLRIASVGARGLPSAYSGIERACDSLYARLVERGHQVTFYCRPEYALQGPEVYRGIRLQPTRCIATRSLDTLSSVFTAMAHTVLMGGYDLVHLHAIPPGVFASMPKLRGIPLVSTIQGLDWQRAKWRGTGSAVIKFGERLIVRNARRMIVVSRDLKSYYQGRYGRVTSYIPNGVERVNASMVADNRVLDQFGLKPKEYFLYLARLVPEKRTQDLVRAYAQIKTKKKLVIAGEAGYTDSYVAGLRELAASDLRVQFVGFQRGNAVHALFHNASGYVLPSEIEGLPLALLEAMSHGTVPLVSDIAPHRELLGSIRGYDLFFQPGDVEGLAASLRKLLAQPTHYEDMGGRIRTFVEANYGWEAITTLTEKLYYDVLANGPDQSFDLVAGSV